MDMAGREGRYVAGEIDGELGDLQDLALQDALSHADRDLTTLANMMKARRDSAENAVDNLK